MLFDLNLPAAGDNSVNSALHPVCSDRLVQRSLSPRANIQRDLAIHIQVSSQNFKIAINCSNQYLQSFLGPTKHVLHSGAVHHSGLLDCPPPLCGEISHDGGSLVAVPQLLPTRVQLSLLLDRYLHQLQTNQDPSFLLCHHIWPVVHGLLPHILGCRGGWDVHHEVRLPQHHHHHHHHHCSK